MGTQDWRFKPPKCGPLSALFLHPIVSKQANSNCNMLPQPVALHITLRFMVSVDTFGEERPLNEVGHPPIFLHGTVCKESIPIAICRANPLLYITSFVP